MERYHPAGVVDGSGTGIATGGDRREQRILRGPAFKRRINAGVRKGAGEIRSKHRPIGSVHHRCSIHQ